MFDREKWMEIAHTVVSNPLRTALTGLSVALGIFILVVMQGLGFGLENGVKAQFQDDATNSLWISTSSTQLAYKGYKPNRWIAMDNADAEALLDQADRPEVYSRRATMWGSQIAANGKEGNFSVRGVDPGHLELEQTDLTAGRYISARDVAETRKVAVIGEQIRKELYAGTGVEPVGSYIRLRGVLFRVVGTFDDPGSRWENQVAYLPLSTVQSYFRAGEPVDQLILSTGEMDLASTTDQTAALAAFLRERKSVHPDDESAVEVRNNNENFAQFQSIFDGIRLFIWGIGIMTLLAGAVGVANIMAIVVKERTKEIGIRKAIGATSTSLVGLIVQESVALMFVSGLVGLILGVWTLEFIAPQVDHEFFKSPEVNFNLTLSALGILVLAGALSGLGPALRAVSIRPVEALKDE
jgi:putative ABC transport system permease protein